MSRRRLKAKISFFDIDETIFHTHALINVVKDGEIEIIFLKIRLYFMLSMSYHLAFPKIDFMKEKYPYLRKYSFLLPFAYFQRGFSKFLNNRQEFLNIIKNNF